MACTIAFRELLPLLLSLRELDINTLLCGYSPNILLMLMLTLMLMLISNLRWGPRRSQSQSNSTISL